MAEEDKELLDPASSDLDLDELERGGRQRRDGDFDRERSSHEERPRANGHDARASADALKAKHVRPTAFLDGLRGLAAFMVYMSHYIVWMYGHSNGIHDGFGYNGIYTFAALPFVRILFTGGAAAVSIFFVLSGYVLTRGPLAMLRAADMRPLRVRLFFAAVRRPFRLFIPVAFVSLVFALALQLPFGMAPLVGWPKPKDNLLAELWSWFVEFWRATNPLITHSISQHWNPYDPAVWTIAIEFAGSLLVFAIVAVLTVVPPRFRSLFLVLLGAAFLFLYEWAMACFVGGVILAMSDVEGVGYVPRLSRLPIAWRPVVYNAIFFAGWYLLSQPTLPNNIEAAIDSPGWGWLTVMIPSSYYNGEYWRFWNQVGSTMVVYGSLRLRWLQKFLLLSPVRWLGYVSFSLYLVHIPMFWIIGDRIYRLLGTLPAGSGDESWFDNRLAFEDFGPTGFSAKFILAQMILLPLNLVVSKWCTVLVDEPSVKVGQWIETKLRGK
jgi:peptidoglycan/LPS O-acetylase OafA/YrhL